MQSNDKLNKKYFDNLFCSISAKKYFLRKIAHLRTMFPRIVYFPQPMNYIPLYAVGKPIKQIQTLNYVFESGNFLFEIHNFSIAWYKNCREECECSSTSFHALTQLNIRKSNDSHTEITLFSMTYSEIQKKNRQAFFFWSKIKKIKCRFYRTAQFILPPPNT